jgi:tetratricopeptide (TPR) repeat protein
MQQPQVGRAEFEKGLKDLNQNHNESAAQHMEKAVVQYDEFAAARFELGKLYTASDPGKARYAFEKAIAADDHFVDSYTRLGALQLDAKDNLGAIQSSSRALEIQPLNSLANFIHAAGNYNLDRLDEAEKSARQAGKTANGNLPQLHVLLANILMRKDDYPSAILEMHAYLQEAPSGPFAAQTRRDLDRLQNAGFDTTSDPTPGH